MKKPEGISTHPDDRHVYVANWFDGNISVIDARNLKVVHTQLKQVKAVAALGNFLVNNSIPLRFIWQKQ